MLDLNILNDMYVCILICLMTSCSLLVITDLNPTPVTPVTLVPAPPTIMSPCHYTLSNVYNHASLIKQMSLSSNIILQWYSGHQDATI